MLTVDGDLDLALVGRRHSVVGDALVVLGLLPLNLRDVQELPFAHQAVCRQEARRHGRLVNHIAGRRRPLG